MAQSERMVFEDENDAADALQPGTWLLGNQFRVTGYLNRGGFGIVYTGIDRLDRKIVIKECFLDSICVRQGDNVVVPNADHRPAFTGMVDHFVREARALAAFDHPNIVPVNLVFEENGTAYMAMKWIEGIDLLDWIEDHGEPDPEFAVRTLKRILLALDQVHRKGMLHRDLSPENILLDQEDSPVLIDFGAAKQLGGGQEPELRAVKEGYSPPCFYDRTTVDHAPSSDLYSLGATFHHLITGEPPVDALIRVASDDDPYVPLAGRFPAYSLRFLNTIDSALSLEPLDRPQSATEWLERIDDVKSKVTSLFGAGTPVRMTPSPALNLDAVPTLPAAAPVEPAASEDDDPEGTAIRKTWRLPPKVEWSAFAAAAGVAAVTAAFWSPPQIEDFFQPDPVTDAASLAPPDGVTDIGPALTLGRAPGRPLFAAMAAPGPDQVPSARPAPIEGRAARVTPAIGDTPSAPNVDADAPGPLQRADAVPTRRANRAMEAAAPDAVPSDVAPGPNAVGTWGGLRGIARAPRLATPDPMVPVALTRNPADLDTARSDADRADAPAPDAALAAAQPAPGPAADAPRPRQRASMPLDVMWTAELPFRAALEMDPGAGVVLTVSDAGDVNVPGNDWLSAGAAISKIGGIEVGRLSEALASAGAGGDTSAPFLVLVEARTAPDQPFEERTLTLYRRGTVTLPSGVVLTHVRRGEDWSLRVDAVPVGSEAAVQTGDVIVGRLPDGAPIRDLDVLRRVLADAAGDGKTALPLLVDRGDVRTVAALPLTPRG